MNYSVYDRSKLIDKETIYDHYCVLDDFPMEYDKITRNKMLETCVDIYNENPEILLDLFNEEELEILFTLDYNSKVKYDSKYANLYKYFILSSDKYLDYLSVSEELINVFDYCKNIYLNKKEEIEKNKEGVYFIVGLFRVFGVLTIKEVNYIMKDLNLKYEALPLMHSLYAKRFLDLNYYTYDKEYSLKELTMYKYDLAQTHPKKIRLKYNFKQFVDVGIDYYVKSSPEYKKLALYPKVYDFYNSINKNDMILYKGCGLSNYGFEYRFANFFEQLDEEEKSIFITFFELLPSYVLQKNQDNILSDEDGKLFYNVLFPFLDYAAFAYDLPFEYENIRFNAHQAYDILQNCIKDDFSIVDNYINDANLNDEEKGLILGLKKFKKGPFVVVKHLKAGSVFSDEKNLYLVKGILTAIETMEYIAQTPTLCETVLIPFKNQITYFSVLAPLPISVGSNMKKHFEDEYKLKKDQIIKKL